MKYPQLAEELSELLETDQAEVKAAARLYLSGEAEAYAREKKELRASVSRRMARVLEILAEIKEPSISNIGSDGAVAMSVLATHDGLTSLKVMLDVFEELYERHPDDCRYQSIPPMFDAVRLHERRPQRFGTQWFTDADRYPFLPTVEDFEHLDERREQYGIGPLRWMKSLAIPESEQPWLRRPIEEAVMRDPTPEEYRANLGD